MRIVGRDYVLKIASQEFCESVFIKRKKYFAAGEPSEMGKGSKVYLVMKSQKDSGYHIVGDAKVTTIRRLGSHEKDCGFASSHGWKFVIELEELRKYPKGIPVEEVFLPRTIQKIRSQRPFGIDLLPDEAIRAKGKVEDLLAQIR